MKTSYKKLLLLVLMLPLNLLAQSKLQGVVTDKTTGQPLPGVNVTVKGTNNGVSTNFDGQFSLSNLKNGDAVLFTFLGFKEQTITFSGQNNITVVMQEESSKLDEVVVVGYGSVKKKDATGSASVLSTKEFNKGAILTAENLLNGRVAGVTINTSGAPGSGSEIRIRGGSSLFTSNDPLIVIDGLPIENKTATGSTSFLASLNPSTIESMTILKDASATAIYGSRASNGVIIITTKKGSKNLSVDYNVQFSIGKLQKTVDVLNSSEFVNAIETYFPDETNLLGIDDPTTSATDNLATPGIIEGRILYNTDWQKEIYRKTTETVNQDLTLRGNLFKAVPTRLTLGNTYQLGLRLTNKFTRNSVGLALNPTLFKDHLKLSVNANYSNERNRFTNGVEGGALRFDPTKPVRLDGSIWGGYYENTTSPTELSNTARNPVSELLLRNDTGLVNRIFGNVQADYKLHFFPDLRAVVNVGIDKIKGERSLFLPKYAGTADGNGTSFSGKYGNDQFESSESTNKLFDGYLVYNKQIGKLNLEATAGYSYQKFESENFTTRNRLNPTSAGPETTIDTDLVLIGFFGRTNLTLNEKYLLTLTYRRDGSSRFPTNEKWGNFPAASFAWKMNKDLLKEDSVISDLKLRLGWGITGQQDLPNDARNYYLPIYSTGNTNSQYYFGPETYIVGLPSPTNPFLKWEETTTYNAGLDYGILNNRITGSIDAFYKQSDDLLANVAFADGGNFSNAGWQNIGSFTTKGIELNINAEVAKTENWNWNLNFNATKYERRIKELAFGSNILVGGIGGGTGGTIQVHSEGYTPNSFFVYKQLYDADNNPIEGAYADLNNDGIINNNDRYIYNNPDPDFVLGFQSNMNYKNFDFSFNLRASIGNRIYNNVNSSRAQLNLLKDNTVLGNIPSSALESGFTTTSDVILSDYYIENASFLRMDNATLGYTIPKWIDGKASLRFNIGVQNPFVITKYSGLDPEITGGIDNTIYPRQRQILFGANVKF
ncbi:SusC/RagA family TonB-linked outer membrane protein [Flavobacterium amniphilum]|uniref:SusC/RagA family TonB-linked outer membrane protein n=1 Tax=Flavobacterium amniphilum TaxID=1834035 RepID=UPI00202AB2B9|nr:SusC/RagA family TonB-linked outer membrane protein [Flavobacterium amniphilum]MCL9806497.1 SusC/RagA family TonB-linked outer membrane protein [Flavobacterium amniphilum]